MNIKQILKVLQTIIFAKLSLNFNFNLLECWDSFTLNSFTPLNYSTTQPKIMMILNSFLNLQIHWIKQLKYLQENIDLAELKKILSKNDTRKSPKSKSISSQIIVFKQLKKKEYVKSMFLDPKITFLCDAFFWPAL